MAYDSKTYGQSPFGNSPDPDEGAERNSIEGRDETVAESAALVNPFPSMSTVSEVQPVEQLANKLGPVRVDSSATIAKTAIATGMSKRRPRTARSKAPSSKSSSGSATAKPSRKSKKTRTSSKTTKTQKATPETVEAVLAGRFQVEDLNAYLSLLYKVGISGLIWAVLRLVRYQLSDRAIATINIIIHPVLVSVLALVGTAGLTFWLRRILRDLALHTQQISFDAEVTDGKYRPTLEIVGDSLDYNPKLRQQLARLSNAASILICTLISYVMTSLLLPWE